MGGGTKARRQRPQQQASWAEGPSAGWTIRSTTETAVINCSLVATSSSSSKRSNTVVRDLLPFHGATVVHYALRGANVAMVEHCVEAYFDTVLHAAISSDSTFFFDHVASMVNDDIRSRHYTEYESLASLATSKGNLAMQQRRKDVRRRTLRRKDTVSDEG